MRVCAQGEGKHVSLHIRAAIPLRLTNSVYACLTACLPARFYLGSLVSDTGIWIVGRILGNVQILEKLTNPVFSLLSYNVPCILNKIKEWIHW